jgi:apolipoprotein N-acyltransferase
VSRGAELIVNPSNDDWFASEAAAHHQIAAARFRAVENRRPLLRPSTSGRSVVLDAHGRILAAARFGEAQGVEADVRLGDTRTLYARWLELAPGSGAGLALAPLFYLAARRRHST